jgi:hypothetical protein
LCKIGSENDRWCAPNSASALTFLEQYLKDGNEFLNHIGQVTGDET